MSLGLALSGGGSRAAAFHRGTLRALEELGILPSIDVVSTVSGGSIFGAAWMASKKRNEDTGRFLNYMGEELEKGFIARSIRPRAAKMLLPGQTRTNVLADTFDSIFFKGMKLGELPDEPKLCVNVSVLNNGHVGKFSKGYFKCAGIVSPKNEDKYSEEVDLKDYPVALAATASAAVPGLLSPIYLKRGERGILDGWGKGDLKKHDKFALVDGGVLDNLGVQSLLSEMSGFSTWDIVLSDAGTKEELWEPKNIAGKAARSLGGIISSAFCVGTGLLSIDEIKRVINVMLNKEVREMRSNLFEEQARSWLETAINEGNVTEALKGYVKWECGKHDARTRRKILFVRVNQNWDDMITHIPVWRLNELKERTGLNTSRLPGQGNVDEFELFLHGCDVDLSEAKDIYKIMGGIDGVKKANGVSTSFSALSRDEIDALYYHALWQVHALNQIYWK
jgi:predicted acylesterase/phospholipase RssA